MAEETPEPETLPEPEATPEPDNAPESETTPTPDGIPASPTPAPADTGEEKEETPVLANRMLVAPRSGEPNSNFADVAEGYYGDHAQNPLPIGDVSMQ